MAKFKFHLKEVNGKKETPVILFCHWNKQQVKVYPGIMVLPEHWNKRLGRVREVKGNRIHKELNLRLKRFEEEAEEIFEKLEVRLSRIPAKEEVKEVFARALTKKINPADENDLRCVYHFILKECKRIDAQLSAAGKPLTKNTLSSTYKQTANLLSEFKNGRMDRLMFDQITSDFYVDFIRYCTDKKGFKPNNIGKHVKNLKAVMKRAKDQGLHENDSFLAFQKPVEDVDAIYLNPSELKKLESVEFEEKDKHLEISRDLFLIGCWTGLRYSDWLQFANKDLSKDLIDIRVQKTGRLVTIPLHPTVKSIYAKYEGKLPKPKENQPFNRDLKVIGEKAKLEEPITQNVTKGGIKSTYTTPKYDLITTHSARRSFATNLYNMGIPSIDIMQITGHRTEKSFLRYIKVTSQEAAKRILTVFNDGK